jgi:clan AA aspartic protease
MHGREDEVCRRRLEGGVVGLTHVTVRVTDVAKQGAPFEDEFLVDTGSIDCLAPRSKLQAAGVAPEGKRVYELDNGAPVEMEFGFARVAFMGDETVTQIIFGPEGAEPILGVVALENTGVVVDPVTHELKRLHARPLKSARRLGGASHSQSGV